MQQLSFTHSWRQQHIKELSFFYMMKRKALRRQPDLRELQGLFLGELPLYNWRTEKTDVVCSKKLIQQNPRKTVLYSHPMQYFVEPCRKPKSLLSCVFSPFSLHIKHLFKIMDFQANIFLMDFSVFLRNAVGDWEELFLF